jgi:divalent metal cation (Fe/Co/Zn/Cd) transporter
MKNQSMRTVVVSLVAGFAVALTKLGAAVVTGSSAMAAEAAHSFADAGNDLFLLVAQRRGARDRDDRHPMLGSAASATCDPAALQRLVCRYASLGAR